MEDRSKRAVALLSGGIDSVTTTAKASKDGFEIFAITFAYGQKNSFEIVSVKHISQYLKIKNHPVLEIPSKIFDSSALSAESEVAVPKNREISLNDIPVTYVPGRNILFLSFAIAYAESIGASDIFIGANSIDYSGYPDCRPEFLKAFEEMANIGTKAGVMGNKFTIHAPLILLKKSEIIRLGVSLGVDYSLTHSCYDPPEQGFACGECDSCLIRKSGFRDAGVPDPTNYKRK